MGFKWTPAQISMCAGWAAGVMFVLAVSSWVGGYTVRLDPCMLEMWGGGAGTSTLFWWVFFLQERDSVALTSSGLECNPSVNICILTGDLLWMWIRYDGINSRWLWPYNTGSWGLKSCSLKRSIRECIEHGRLSKFKSTNKWHDKVVNYTVPVCWAMAKWGTKNATLWSTLNLINKVLTNLDTFNSHHIKCIWSSTVRVRHIGHMSPAKAMMHDFYGSIRHYMSA